MRKVYETPVFEFDSYELDEFVANCGNTAPNHSRSDCELTWGGIVVFDSDYNGECWADDSDFEESENDGYCYHIPVDDIRFFGS